TASAGTVTAALATEFVNFNAITVDSGARWTLTNTASLASGITLTDLGTLTALGNVTNAGTILADSGSFIIDPASFVNSGYLTGGSVVNTGLIKGGNGGVRFSSVGTLANSGTIIGTTNNGVYIAGSLSNAVTGLIEGAQGVLIFGAAGTATNFGTIIGTTGYG